MPQITYHLQVHKVKDFHFDIFLYNLQEVPECYRSLKENKLCRECGEDVKVMEIIDGKVQDKLSPELEELLRSLNHNP